MNMQPQVQQALSEALTVAQIAQPAVAMANPTAGIALEILTAAGQYAQASNALHLAGVRTPAQTAADWQAAAQAVADGAAAFNARYPAAAAIVAASAAPVTQAPASIGGAA